MFAPQGGGFGFAPPPQHRNLLPQLPGTPAASAMPPPGAADVTIGDQLNGLKKAFGMGPQMPGASLAGTAPVTGGAGGYDAGGAAMDAASGGEGGIEDFLTAFLGA